MTGTIESTVANTGRRCGATPLSDSAYCFWHDPDHAEEAAAARKLGGHRRKLVTEAFPQLLPPWDKRIIHLIVLLRLAVMLHRGRRITPLPQLELVPRGRSLEARFPGRWLREHPLTVADLTREVDLLKEADFRLKIFSRRA